MDNGTQFLAKAQARAFEFDASLGPDATQADVFAACKAGPSNRSVCSST